MAADCSNDLVGSHQTDLSRRNERKSRSKDAKLKVGKTRSGYGDTRIN